MGGRWMLIKKKKMIYILLTVMSFNQALVYVTINSSSVFILIRVAWDLMHILGEQFV